MNKRITFTLVVLLLTAGTGLADLTDGLVAYYKLDATSGAVVDETGNNDGVNYGATRGVAGKVGSAYLFDGQTDKIVVPHSTSLDLTGPITLSAWIKSDGTYWFSSVVAKKKEYVPEVGYSLHTQDNKAVAQLTYAIGNSHYGGGVASDTFVIDGQWHLLTGTYDGAEMRMYVDGQLETSVEYSDDYDSNNEPLIIGHHYYPYYDGREGSHNWALNGAIDEVRIYNRALDQSEVTELYNEETEPPPPPQAAKVAYHSYTRYEDFDSRLYLLDLTTQNGDWVSDSWDDIDSPMNPHFSPDGTQIVFMALPEGEEKGRNNLEIYLWTIDGGEPERLTTNSVPDEDPKFCPDGRIVFKRSDRIYIMNSDRTGATRLTENSFEESMPYYTKDGTHRILYMSRSKSNADIRIVDENNKTNDKYVLNASVGGIQEYYPIAWYGKTFLYTRWNNSLNEHDQIYSCDIDSLDAPYRLPINKWTFVDYSDAYPMNRDYILFSKKHILGSYNLFIGNVHTGKAWPISDYGGENTVNDELGAACWPANISSEILINLASHADLHVYDSEGRHTGIDYVTNAVEESIPGSDFKILDEGGNEVPYDGYTPGEGLRQIISLPEINAGTYKIEIVGTSEGPFRLTVSGIQDGYTMTSQSYEGNIVKGVILSTIVEMASVLDALTLIWEGQFGLQLEPVIDFEPDTLNLESKGKFVTAYIELPKGFDVSHIVVSSLLLNGSVHALSKPSEVGDYDEDGIADLMVKFDHQEVVEVLEPGIQMVVLSGQLNDETPIAGVDFVRVIGGESVEAVESEFDWAMPEEFIAYLEENLQTTADDAIDAGDNEEFDVEEAVGFILFEASGIINELGPETFNNEESVFELTCALDDVFNMLDEGMYFEVMVILEGDILERMNGCANTGEPDEDDWVTSIEGQALLYPLLTETIELLESML